MSVEMPGGSGRLSGTCESERARCAGLAWRVIFGTSFGGATIAKVGEEGAARRTDRCRHAQCTTESTSIRLSRSGDSAAVNRFISDGRLSASSISSRTCAGEMRDLRRSPPVSARGVGPRAAVGGW